mmetsp:Transcript_25421/g.60435  ORF Transcript_25421/g.60435 Transcript_25421/m.60435 type:complete len:209 (+) Transcript_25421:5686-6312(+)
MAQCHRLPTIGHTPHTSQQNCTAPTAALISAGTAASSSSKSISSSLVHLCLAALEVTVGGAPSTVTLSSRRDSAALVVNRTASAPPRSMPMSKLKAGRIASSCSASVASTPAAPTAYWARSKSSWTSECVSCVGWPRTPSSRNAVKKSGNKVVWRCRKPKSCCGRFLASFFRTPACCSSSSSVKGGGAAAPLSTVSPSALTHAKAYRS